MNELDFIFLSTAKVISRQVGTLNWEEISQFPELTRREVLSGVVSSIFDNGIVQPNYYKGKRICVDLVNRELIVG